MAFPHGGLGIGGANFIIGAETRGIRQTIHKAVGEIKGEMQAGAQEVERSSNRWNSAFGLIGAAAKVGMVGIAAAVGTGIAAAIQFESAWAGVRKTVDATPQELEALRQQFRDLAKEIPVSVNELAKIGETAGAMGIAKDSLLEFTKTVALIGQTTNVTTDAAATALGQLSNVLHLTQDDYSRFASTLVDLGNKGASTESQILEIASRAGSAAGLMKIGAKDVLAYSSAVASLGIEVEAGGTSLQSFFLKANAIVGAGSGIQAAAAKAGISVQKFVDTVQKGGKPLTELADKTGLTTKKLKELVTSAGGLDEMARVAGMSAAEFKRAFEKDAAGALAVFLEGLGKLKGSEQQGVLKDLKFGDVRMLRTLLGLANGADLLRKNLENADAAWQANNAAAEEAEKRFETTGAQLGLLKNLLQDYLISLGDLALPAVKSLLGFLRDDIPKAITFLGAIWKSTLSPAFQTLSESVFGLVEAIGKLFGNGDKVSNWGDVAKTAVVGVANGLAAVAKYLSVVIDGVKWLLNNPLGQWVARLVIAVALLKTVIGGTQALIGSLQGASTGLLRSIPGVNRLVGGSAAAAAGGDPGLNASAGRLTGAAGQLENAASALKGAAGAQGRAIADLPQKWGFAPRQPNQGGAINFQPLPQGAGRVPGLGIYNQGQLVAVDRAAQDFYLRNRRQLENAGAGIVKFTGARVMDGIENAARSGASLIRTVGGTALGLAGKAFWPLMVAGIATEVLKAPIGDFVSQNTQFKRAGAKIKEDFVGGIVALVESWATGSDLFVAIPQIRLGKQAINTKALGKVDLTEEQVRNILGGGLQGQLTTQEVAPSLLKGLERLQGEEVLAWYKRIQQTLRDAGRDTSAIDRIIRDATHFQAAGRGGAIRVTSLSDSQKAALEAAISEAVGGYVRNTLTETRQTTNTAIMQALQAATEGRFTLTELTQLPPSTYDAIAKLLLQQATLDPKTFNLALGRIIAGRVAIPQAAPTGDMEDRRGAIAPGLQSPSIARQAELSAQAARLEEAIHTLDKSRQDLLDAFSKTPDAQGNLPTEQAIADYKRQLQESQEKDRQTSLEVLKFINDSISGLEVLSKDAGTRKRQLANRQKVLDEINTLLGLKGTGQELDWTALINWQAQLSESTGETARKQLAAEVKKWSVQAAAEGGKAAASSFVTNWKDEFDKAQWEDTAESLRTKLNGLIPGKANDIAKGKFQAWLKDAQSGKFTPEELRQKMNDLIPGKANDLSKAAFAKWFKDVTTFETVPEQVKDDMRAKLNALIPKTASDLDKADFEAWLKDAQSGDFTSDQLRQKMNDLIPGTADDLSKSKFNQWFKAVTASGLVVDSEGLRAKLNALIPKTANDVDKANFQAWLRDAQSGQFSPEELRGKLNKLIPGKADDLSKGEFAKWFKDVTNAGPVLGEAQERLRQEINSLIPGTADDIPKEKFQSWWTGLQSDAFDDTHDRSADMFKNEVNSLPPSKPSDDAIKTIGGWFNSLISQGVGGGPNDATDKKLNAAGVGVAKEVAEGMKSKSALDIIGDAASTVLGWIRGFFPSSPVKKGPLKHPFLPNAGAAIVAQVSEGIAKSTLEMKPRVGSFSSVRLPPGAMRAEGRAKKVEVHANNLQFFSAAEAESVNARLEFLAQEGR